MTDMTYDQFNQYIDETMPGIAHWQRDIMWHLLNADGPITLLPPRGSIVRLKALASMYQQQDRPGGQHAHHVILDDRTELIEIEPIIGVGEYENGKTYGPA